MRKECLIRNLHKHVSSVQPLTWIFLPIAFSDSQIVRKHVGILTGWVLFLIFIAFHTPSVYMASIHIYGKMRNSILNISCFPKLVSWLPPLQGQNMFNEQSQHEKAVEYDTFFFFFLDSEHKRILKVVRKKEKLVWDLVLYSFNLEEENNWQPFLLFYYIMIAEVCLGFFNILKYCPGLH